MTPSITHSRRMGLTLIELLVVLAVTSAIFVGFGTILNSTQKIVNGSQGLMRANARADMRGISKMGFLAIRDNGTKLIFTTAGPMQSLSYLHGRDSATGLILNNLSLGGVVSYGSSSNDHLDDPYDILFRRLEVFDPDPARAHDGIITADMTQYFSMSIDDTKAEIISRLGLLPANDTVRVPAANTMDSVNKLWQVLTAGIDELQISYAYMNAAGTALEWSIVDKTWTSHNQNDWPMLIRFKFKIYDDAMPEELRDTIQYYEVVTTVGQ